VRRQLRERRDALAAAIADLLPGCQLDLIPGGGMHLWLRLPEGCSDADVTEAAAARGVAVTPGRASFPSEPPASFLRLSYAGEEPPALTQAVRVLAGVIGR
jgi:DNA-binding transcriptional MocR family regulator